MCPTDYSVLYNAVKFVAFSNDQKFLNEVGDYFDLPVLADYYMFLNVVFGIDNACNNMVLACYDCAVDKKITFAVWDLDATVGQHYLDTEGFYHADEIQPENELEEVPTNMCELSLNKLFMRVKNIPLFKRMVVNRYWQLRSTVLDPDDLVARYQTIFKRLDDCGAHTLKAFPGIWRDDYKVIDEEYKEGIYVGYRWAEKQRIKPLFAFGHGLSYTTFKLGKPSADKQRLTANDQISFTVSVTNTGNCAGAETVQLYIADKQCSVDRPIKELKAFQKVFLQPGESRSVSLTIGRDALSFYDETKGLWTAEPGEFEALIGTSSDKITDKVVFSLF